MALSENPLQRLVAEIGRAPGDSAVLVDLDGCLAEIVSNSADVRIPDATKRALTELASRVSLVAVVTARDPFQARQIVGVAELVYVGSLGAATLRPGSDEMELHPMAQQWAGTIERVARSVHRSHLRRLGVVNNSSVASSAFHYGHVVADQRLAAGLRELERAAEHSGLRVVRNAFSTDLYPPDGPTKGDALHGLLDGREWAAVAYAGDGPHDVVAMQTLRAMAAAGSVRHATAIGVRSPENPADLTQHAHVVVDSPRDVGLLLTRIARELRTPGAPGPTRARPAKGAPELS